LIFFGRGISPCVATEILYLHLMPVSPYLLQQD
jgi:hypothetical protein